MTDIDTDAQEKFDAQLANIDGEAPPERRKSYYELYHELIMEVAKKYPGETRHETARRYIRERETPNPDQVAAAEPT